MVEGRGSRIHAEGAARGRRRRQAVRKVTSCSLLDRRGTENTASQWTMECEVVGAPLSPVSIAPVIGRHAEASKQASKQRSKGHLQS